MRLAIGWAVLALALLPQAARAEWMEASSNHFVIYADDTERDLRRFSEQLERYHAAMAFLTGTPMEKPSPSNRVTVYVVRNDRVVRDLHGGDSRYLRGFYVPRAGGSLAIVPEVNAGTGRPTLSMIVLLHEYAHHFLITTSSMGMPRWLSEGGAEFFASSSFESDGSVALGRAAVHRGAELYNAPNVTAADLLDPATYERRPKRDYDAFYGKSWLLYHYLVFDEARQGQMARYIAALASGKGQREAGLEAFGDFKQLERDLDQYLRRRSIRSFKLPPDLLKTGPIALRPLRSGEAAMMPIRVRSRVGVDEEQAKALLVEARAVAARFPADPAVLSALAEAEHDAGNDAEAITAADSALAIDPAQVNAYIQKGYALFRMAEDAPDKAAAYIRARAPFLALNRRENDHPLPLIYYYRSFASQGKPPNPVAIDGLARASQLAPFDFGLRMTLGSALIKAGRQNEAQRALQPVAFNPHGGPLADAAGRVLDRLVREPGWNGADFAGVVAPPEATQTAE